MDSALKQRLLGAAVLIALAIIFVPMFLSSSPPKQDNTTLDLQIPPTPERKFETRTLPATGPSTPAVSEANKIVTVDTNAARQVDARPQDAAAQPQPVAAPVAKPVPESAPVATPVEAAKAVVATASAAGRFAVHLGVYADRGHADALVAKLKKLGYGAYDEAVQYQGKPALRVRVGPYADRAAAESARLKIKQGEPKVPSSVIDMGMQSAAAEAKTDAPASAVAANRAGGWAVQLGAFKVQTEANKLRDRLRNAGIAGFVDRIGSGDAALWRVRAGPYVDRADADKARATIDAKLKVKGIIVTQP